MLSKYTNEVVLTYDGDEAGQNATRRAIPMLERTGLRVKILRMQGAKDPDEFLRKYGADRFKLLLKGSENQAEYRLRSLQMRFDLTNDEQKVEFAKQAAELISTFSTMVEREIYATRAAEMAGVTPEVMKMEVNRAYRRRQAAEKKSREKKDLEINTARQPRARELRYDNLRSATAEEGLLRMVLREPALFARTEELTAQSFSVPMFGVCFALLKQRWQEDLSVRPDVLSDALTPAEMAHLTSILQEPDCTVSETAFDDYVHVILDEQRRASFSGETDLKAMQEQLRKKKGYGGT